MPAVLAGFTINYREREAGMWALFVFLLVSDHPDKRYKQNHRTRIPTRNIHNSPLDNEMI